MPLSPHNVPVATYRVQLGPDFGFDRAAALAGYLSELGVSTLYLSPFFKARAGSSHGYDVVDHRTVDPALGDENDFGRLAAAMAEHRLGLMLDLVPNHMGINDSRNRWWQDVLEHGMYSPHALYFDIDWMPAKESLRGKVLLPFLGEPFGEALESQRLSLDFVQGRFIVRYHDRWYPVAVPTWPAILALAAERLPLESRGADEARAALAELIEQAESLPWTRFDPSVDRRARAEQTTAIRGRLSAVIDERPVLAQAIETALAEINGRAGDAHSFDLLEQILARQAYRLCFWRVATEEINYRRFFDINDLAAIRVEQAEVFRAVHELVFRWIDRGWVQALRIDHPDGLLDPRKYFEDLQAEAARHLRDGPAPAGDERSPADDGRGQVDTDARGMYVVVEKILALDEDLDREWPVCGTTGYDYLNVLTRLFIDRAGAAALRDGYMRLTQNFTTFPNVVYESKKTVMRHSMSSELTVLAAQLERIAEQHRSSRDYTLSALRAALAETIACFPVYRTYIRPGEADVSDADRHRIALALRTAAWRNPEIARSIFAFIAEVLLKRDPDGLSDEHRLARRQFVLRFQQVTGPVTAKGLEDTSFYRYYPLASLIEVGGDPRASALTVEDFHRSNERRALEWPLSMSASATHDTKRGEDVRARLNVLSEIPDDWTAAVLGWIEANRALRRDVDGELAPDDNEQYLLYQTLVGAWPVEASESAGRPSDSAPVRVTSTFTGRIAAYMVKAVKEAKIHTSWLNPREEYEQAVEGFVRDILAEDNAVFLEQLDALARSIADAGFVNSLAQTVLKMTAPGVPDFYQGTELWDFSLVDPDNRRPVDFDLRRRMLSEVSARYEQYSAACVPALMAEWPDARIKLFVLWRTLDLRRRYAQLFRRGSYVPLAVLGDNAAHVCAFARVDGPDWAVVVVPRLTILAGGPPLAAARRGEVPAAWSRYGVQLPAEAPRMWRHAVTDAAVAAEDLPGGERVLSCGELFQAFPVAILEGEPLPQPPA